MILVLPLLFLILPIALVIYCCLRIHTPYDQEADDEQQERFLSNH